MTEFWQSIRASLEGSVPQLLAAVAILVVGWLVASVLARLVRAGLSTYRDHEARIRSGAYRRGRDPVLDRAVRLHARVTRYLQQAPHESCSARQARRGLLDLAPGKPAKAA